MDIVGGIWVVVPATGELRAAKVTTAVDDDSRPVGVRIEGTALI